MTDSQGRSRPLLLGLLPAETIEFSVSYAAEKSMPFVRCKSEHRTFGVPAVADADLTLGQARHLDAVAVGETQQPLNPVKTQTRPFRQPFNPSPPPPLP